MMGGDVTVASEPDKGSVFTVRPTGWTGHALTKFSVLINGFELVEA
jgi:hypothetical protein